MHAVPTDVRTLVIANKNYSSWSLRGWLALRLAKVPFEEKMLRIDNGELSDSIPSYGANGLVPLLVDGETQVWDSLAICEYVNETYAQGHLWPSDPTARAQARSIAAEMHSGFTEVRNLMPMNIRGRKRNVKRTPELEKKLARIHSIWDQTSRSSPGPWLFESLSIADIMFAPVVFRFSTYDVELEANAKAYLSAMLSHPLMQEWAAAAIAEPWVIPRAEVGTPTS